MIQRAIAVLCFTTAMLYSSMESASAAPPWTSLLPFKRVDSDPKKPHELTDISGPWMVYAIAFTGEKAKQQAHQLALELRKEYKLPAYVYNQRFDFTERLSGLGFDIGSNQDLRPQRMKYLQDGAIEECAVLVGNFESIDDPELAKALVTLKYARPSCLTGGAGEAQHRFASLRELQRKMSKDEDKRKRGPMANAFATRNPLLPAEYFAPNGPDKFVLQLNRDVQYSLLKNKGKYTVRVARFGGFGTINQREIEELERTDKISDRLEQAAIRANQLTLALRKQGADAYQYHDRKESVVTVGSFDWLGDNQIQGEWKLNPAVEAVVKTYGAQQQSNGKGGISTQPRVIAKTALDVHPEPIEVPRASVATAYVR